MDLKNKTALVTGASSGIGLEFAAILSAMGCNLVISSRNTARLNELKADLEKRNGSNVVVVPSDLSLPDGALNLYKDCREKGLHVDILINNAGAGIFGEVIGSESPGLIRMLTLNILSLTELCRLFGKDMAEKGKGWVLNVSSMGSRMAMPLFASYGASKSYVQNFSLAFREEVKNRGVNVTCILPGYVRTSFDKNALIGNSRYLKFSSSLGASPYSVAKTGIKALFKGKAMVIDGFSNKLLASVLDFIPRSFIAKTVYSFISGMMKE